jgi:hypothetical protein
MSLPPPRRKQPTDYKQPKRINAVSMVMLTVMVASIYVGYCCWPVLSLRLRAKGDLEDVMNQYWRANLRGERVAKQEIAQIRKDLGIKLAADGVKDKKLDFVFDRSGKRISIEAHFTAPAYFPGLDRTYLFQLAPRAETDAGRVDW